MIERAQLDPVLDGAECHMNVGIDKTGKHGPSFEVDNFSVRPF